MIFVVIELELRLKLFDVTFVVYVDCDISGHEHKRHWNRINMEHELGFPKSFTCSLFLFYVFICDVSNLQKGPVYID